MLAEYDRLVDYGSTHDPISIFLSLDLEEGVEEGGEGGIGSERGNEGVGERGNEGVREGGGEGVSLDPAVESGTPMEVAVAVAAEAITIVTAVVAAAGVSVEVGSDNNNTTTTTATTTTTTTTNNINNTTSNNNDNTPNINHHPQPSDMSHEQNSTARGAISLLWANHCALWFNVISSNLTSTRASGLEARASVLEARASGLNLLSNQKTTPTTTTTTEARVYEKVKILVKRYPDLVYSARDRYNRRTLDVATPAMKRCIHSGE